MVVNNSDVSSLLNISARERLIGTIEKKIIKNKNSMISNSMIEEQLWNNEEFINSNVIQVTIYNLRKKIGKDYIKSFRGLGYKIEI